MATFALTKALAAQEPACLDCHADLEAPIAQSVHGFAECSDCHAGIDLDSHPDQIPDPSCDACHSDVLDEFATSAHSTQSLGSRPGFETFTIGCDSCHGNIHSLVPSDSPLAPTHSLRMAETCGGCHADAELAARTPLRWVLPLEAYLSSVHNRALHEGKQGATCADCHGSHGILGASHPASKVHAQEVPGTCGQCHEEIQKAFSKSIHGQALQHGITDSPTCTDCHGEHRILSPAEEGSPIFASNIPKMTCGRCHGSVQMAERFGLNPSMVSSYEDSYHGLAGRAGSINVANCASCHGVHDILPSTDPNSHIHPLNLPATCGECHPGAGSRFAIGPVHLLPESNGNPLVGWVKIAYLWLIGLTIGGMVLHNGLDLYRKARLQIRATDNLPASTEERMSLTFRICHGALATSFIILVYTGFALKYPEAFWAQPLLAWEDTVSVRGQIHRLAAIIMLVVAVAHVIHLVSSRRARTCIAHMWPNRRDLRDLKEKIAFLLGRRTDLPHSEYLGYPEKMEYLAVVWGTLIMAVSGLVLWFENLALAWGPKWITDLATVVHFYEAILATLAIVVWHFYSVIFDPLVYPMDGAWLTGRSAPGRAAERNSEGWDSSEPAEIVESQDSETDDDPRRDA